MSTDRRSARRELQLTLHSSSNFAQAGHQLPVTATSLYDWMAFQLQMKQWGVLEYCEVCTARRWMLCGLYRELYWWSRTIKAVYGAASLCFHSSLITSVYDYMLVRHRVALAAPCFRPHTSVYPSYFLPLVSFGAFKRYFVAFCLTFDSDDMARLCLCAMRMI